MEKKKLTEDDRKLLEGGGFTEFLRARKARDGRLNAIGEWFLKKKDTGLYIRKEDMRYILK